MTRQPGASCARLRALIEHAAQDQGVTAADLLGPARSARLARTRFAITWLAHHHLDVSFREIGEHLGRRDHTTMIHAARRAEALRASDPAFRDLTDRLLAVILEPRSD